MEKICFHILLEVASLSLPPFLVREREIEVSIEVEFKPETICIPLRSFATIEVAVAQKYFFKRVSKTTSVVACFNQMMLMNNWTSRFEVRRKMTLKTI